MPLLRHGLTRRKVLTLLGASAVSSALPRHAYAGEGLPDPNRDACWRVSFDDDFEDPVRFQRNWRKVTSAGDQTQTLRVPQNDVLRDGSLELLLGHNPDAGNQRFGFTGGYIESASFRQCYGYFECEMTIADEPGVNNAFWLVSDPKTQGTQHFELDVAEAKFPNTVQSSARLWQPTRMVRADVLHPPVKLSAAPHRYGMLWSPRQFAFFFDDVPFFSADNDFAHTPAMLRLSNAVATFAGVTDGDVAGAATVVGRVRVLENSDWANAPTGMTKVN